MNRLLRNVLALLVGIYLGGIAVYANAETIAATANAPNTITIDAQRKAISSHVGGTFNSVAEACTATKNGAFGSHVLCSCTDNGTQQDGVTAAILITKLDAGSSCQNRASINTAYACQSGYTKYTGTPPTCKNTSTVYTCPATGGWSLSGQSCSRPDCQPGEVRDEQTGACEPPPCPVAGTPYSSGWFLIGSSPNASFDAVTCAGTCLVAFNGYAPAGQAIVGGQTQYYARGSWQYLGPSNTCSGGTATPGAQSSLPPDTCGPNQYYGTINGKPVCIDATTGEPANTSPAPPSTTTTQTDNTTNPDGSTTKTETTTNPDGSTTTTTTTTQPNGNSTTTTTTTPPPGEDQTDDFCKKNPDNPMCQEIESGSPAGTSDLYTPESRTVGNVLSDFRAKVQNAPFYSGASNFFNISVPGGACGGMNAQIAVGWGQSFNIDIDSVLCGSTAQLVYSVLGIGVMLAAAWVAFRIAIL